MLPHLPQYRPPPPHDDDWVAMLVALGVVGGSALWVLSSGVLFPVKLSEPRTEDRNTAGGFQFQPAPTVEPASDAPLIVPPPKLPNPTISNSPPRLEQVRVFSDVSTTYWAKAYIDALASQGLIDGLPDGSFAPERSMTRAELAAQIAQTFRLVPQRPPSTFADVSETHWAKAAIERTTAIGFMQGYPDNTFQPDASLSRLQVLIAIATGLSLSESLTPAVALKSIEDRRQVPAWATGKVAAALEAGIIPATSEGTTALRPSDTATRAEVAVMLHGALAYMGAVDPIE